MSLGVIDPASVAGVADRPDVRPIAATASPRTKGWSHESFASGQIQGLIRQVFFSNAPSRVRQVIFSAVDPDTDVPSICNQVGEALALETTESVAVLGGLGDRPAFGAVADQRHRRPLMPLQRIATRVHGNLWLLPPAALEGGSTSSLHSYLGELRREFEFSIIAAPPAAESHAAIAMAEFADGIILVLSANRTRRATARNVKQALEAAQARLLGTVLSDRVFPIPERLYRRL